MVATRRPPPKRVPARRRTTDPSAAAARTSVAGSSKAGSAVKSARPSSAAGKPTPRSRTSTAGVTAAGSPSAGGATPRTSRAGTVPAPSEPLSDDLADDISTDHDNGSPPPPSPAKPPPLSPAVAATMAKRVTEANLAAATAAATVTAAGPRRSPGLARPTTAILPPGTTSTSAVMRPPIASATLGQVKGLDQAPPLEPDPALELVRMNAYSGEFVRALVWVPGGEWVAFAAASVVVLMHVGATPGAAAAGLGVPPRLPQGAGRQRHLLGHTAFVCALAVSADGGLLASAQEGKQALVRLWDVPSGACLAILNGKWGRGWVAEADPTQPGMSPAPVVLSSASLLPWCQACCHGLPLSGHTSGLSCVDISPDVRAVAAVGLDAQARQTVALWNIAELRSAGKVRYSAVQLVCGGVMCAVPVGYGTHSGIRLVHILWDQLFHTLFTWYGMVRTVGPSAFTRHRGYWYFAHASCRPSWSPGTPRSTTSRSCASARTRWGGSLRNHMEPPAYRLVPHGLWRLLPDV